MSQSRRIFNGWKSFSQGFFIGVPLCLTFTDNVCTICQVEGISMQPILNCDSRHKDFVLISRWKAKQFNKIERGSIVSIISPKQPSTLLIKRIIALEGDTIRSLSFKHGNVKVPRGHCWIEGDNHNHSLDSNSFGSVPLGLVNGVATRVVWPPSRYGKLSTQIPPGRNPFGSTTKEPVTSVDDLQNTAEPLLSHTVRHGADGQTVNKQTMKQSGSLQKTVTHLPRNSARHASDITATEE